MPFRYDVEQSHEVSDVEQSHVVSDGEHSHVVSDGEQSYAVCDEEESHVELWCRTISCSLSYGTVLCSPSLKRSQVVSNVIEQSYVVNDVE